MVAEDCSKTDKGFQLWRPSAHWSALGVPGSTVDCDHLSWRTLSRALGIGKSLCSWLMLQACQRAAGALGGTDTPALKDRGVSRQKNCLTSTSGYKSLGVTSTAMEFRPILCRSGTRKNCSIYCHVYRVCNVTNNSTRVPIGYRIYSLWRLQVLHRLQLLRTH
jgi:hypothetical protein